MIDGHEEDKAGLGEDVEDGQEQPGQQELGDFASQAGLEDCYVRPLWQCNGGNW